MSRSKTPEEVRNEHLAAFGERLGPLYNHLLNQTSWLRVRWKQYQELFGTKPERIQMLNEAAGLFFRFVQDSLFEDTLLHICRLTDPPETLGKENLTFQRVPALIDDDDFQSEIKELIDQLCEQCAFARDWRNRRLAHADLSLAMEEGVKPLEKASREQVNAVLDSLHHILERLSQNYLRADLHREVIIPASDAESLLYVIRDGLAYHKRKMEKLKTGDMSEFRPQDEEPV